jgi:hypothetical protein
MSANTRRGRAQTSRWEILAAFIFGVVFVTTILVLAVAFPKPTAFQFTMLMALACAGVAAVVTSFLSLKISLPLKSTLRAGGALAVFALVCLYNPAALVVDTSALEQTIQTEAKTTLYSCDKMSQGSG